MNYRCSLRLLHVLVTSVRSSLLLEPPLAYVPHTPLPDVIDLMKTVGYLSLLDTFEVSTCVMIRGYTNSG